MLKYSCVLLGTDSLNVEKFLDVFVASATVGNLREAAVSCTEDTVDFGCTRHLGEFMADKAFRLSLDFWKKSTALFLSPLLLRLYLYRRMAIQINGMNNAAKIAPRIEMTVITGGDRP